MIYNKCYIEIIKSILASLSDLFAFSRFSPKAMFIPNAKLICRASWILIRVC
jgi:hypothetical protein